MNGLLDKFTGQIHTYESDRAEMTRRLVSHIPFSFVKFGDGEFECIVGRGGANCDGQRYSEELRAALVDAFSFLRDRGDVMLTRGCPQGLFEAAGQFVQVNDIQYADHESLLLYFPSESLKAFYRTLILDRRTKVLVAPSLLGGAMRLFYCTYHVPVQCPNAFGKRDVVLRQLIDKMQDDTVFLFCAGPATKVWIADLLRRNNSITCIDLGSALDPIFIGRTRSPQPSKKKAVMFFQSLGIDGVQVWA